MVRSAARATCAVRQPVATKVSDRLTSIPADSPPNSTSTVSKSPGTPARRSRSRAHDRGRATTGSTVTRRTRSPRSARRRARWSLAGTPSNGSRGSTPVTSRLIRSGAWSATASRRGRRCWARSRRSGSPGTRTRGLGWSTSGGRASNRSRLLRAVAGGRPEQPAPRERVAEHPLGAEGLGPTPHQLASPPREQIWDREHGAVGAHEAVERAALAKAHPVAAALLEDRCELEQPAGIDEVVHAPEPHPLAQAAPKRGQPVPQADDPCRRRVPERRVLVLHVVVERPRYEADVAERESGEGDPVVVEDA